MRSPRQRCLAPRATTANIGSLTSAIGGVGELADIRITCDSGRKGVASAGQCRAIELCNSASNEVSMARTLARTGMPCRLLARIVHESGSFNLTLTAVRLIQSGHEAFFFEERHEDSHRWWWYWRSHGGACPTRSGHQRRGLRT